MSILTAATVLRRSTKGSFPSLLLPKMSWGQSSRCDDGRQAALAGLSTRGLGTYHGAERTKPRHDQAGAHKAAEGLSEGIGRLYGAMIDAAMEGPPKPPPT